MLTLKIKTFPVYHQGTIPRAVPTLLSVAGLVLCMYSYLCVWRSASLIFAWPWCSVSFYLSWQSGLWPGDVCDSSSSSRGGLSEQTLFIMSNASSDRAGTIVSGGLERCQNLLHELIAMVTGTCGAWQADISPDPLYMCINLHIFTLYGGGDMTQGIEKTIFTYRVTRLNL